MKKLLSIVLAAVLLISVMPIGLFNAIASTETERYYTYSVRSAKATITDVSTSIRGDIVIPSTLGGYPVTSIGDHAFMECSSITSIEIPDGVTSIGDSAFYECYDLTSIKIPNSVTSIGNWAFEFCYKLKSVTIPDSVTNIGGSAFRYCRELTSVTLPDSITCIGYDTFYCCTELTSITIPDGVISIGESAFEGCTGLTSVIIPDSVLDIDANAFYHCESLTNISIPNSVISIGSSAFGFCNNIKTLTITKYTTNISVDSFSAVLKTVYFKGTLEDWNNMVYAKDEQFTRAKIICICEGEHTYTDEYDASCNTCEFVREDNLKICDIFEYKTNGDEATIVGVLNNVSVNIVVPSIIENYIVTNIGENAFESCSELNSVLIPNTVTNIESGAFNNCTKLLEVYYHGSELDAKKIYIDTNNSCLTNATWYYSCCINSKNHTFDNACDVDCNVCGDEFSVPGHVYDNDSDADCNECGKIKLDISTLFPDTSNNAWYSNAVRYVVESGIMTGYANGYFGTANGIQRQDFLVILARIDGVNLDDYFYKSPFPDVGDNTYYQAAVNWGYYKGIVNGYENGRFGVGDMINREQIVTFLYRYAKYKGLDVEVSAESAQAIKNQYADYNNVSDYAKVAVIWAIDRGVMNGKNATTIAPAGNAQRCEIAQIMYNIYNKEIF